MATDDSDGDGPSPARILEVGFDFFASKALLSAVELGVFTTLARTDRPLSAGELEERVGLDSRASTDFLDALVALDFLEREDGRYRNTPATAAFLDEDKPSYVGDLLTYANDRLYPLWGSLTLALRTGKPQNELAAGDADGSVFELIYEDDHKQERFLNAMSALSKPFARVIAGQFPWERYDTVCDLGTSEGMFLYQVLDRHDHLEGIGADLPEVRPFFERFAERRGVADRVSFRGLDFFEDPLPAADVYVLGHVLSDWPTEGKRRLLERAYEALPADGALVVYDPIVDDDRRENDFGLLMSLNMLLDSSGGHEYTEGECIEWMRAAGFDEIAAEPLPGMETMLVGLKRS